MVKGRIRSFCAGALLVVMAASVASAGTPSPKGAFFRSLLVPGWGQVALGAGSRAAIYGGVELSAWVLVGGFTAMKHSYRDDYRGLARSIAGANTLNQPMSYYNDLAFYETRVEHNQWAIVNDDEPQFYGAGDDWQWPSPDDRQRYRDRLNASKSMDQAVSYVLGCIAVNHLVSAVDAAKSASRIRADETAQARSSVRFAAVPTPGGGAAVLLTCSLD